MSLAAHLTELRAQRAPAPAELATQLTELRARRNAANVIAAAENIAAAEYIVVLTAQAQALEASNAALRARLLRNEGQ